MPVLTKPKQTDARLSRVILPMTGTRHLKPYKPGLVFGNRGVSSPANYKDTRQPIPGAMDPIITGEARTGICLNMQINGVGQVYDLSDPMQRLQLDIIMNSDAWHGIVARNFNNPDGLGSPRFYMVDDEADTKTYLESTKVEDSLIFAIANLESAEELQVMGMIFNMKPGISPDKIKADLRRMITASDFSRTQLANVFFHADLSMIKTLTVGKFFGNPDDRFGVYETANGVWMYFAKSLGINREEAVKYLKIPSNYEVKNEIENWVSAQKMANAPQRQAEPIAPIRKPAVVFQDGVDNAEAARLESEAQKKAEQANLPPLNELEQKFLDKWNASVIATKETGAAELNPAKLGIECGLHHKTAVRILKERGLIKG